MTTLLKGKELKKGMVFNSLDDPIVTWREVLNDFNKGKVTAKPQGAETSLQTVAKINIGANGLYAVRDDTWDLK